MPVEFGSESASGRVAAELDVGTDGSLVQDEVSGAPSSRSGFSTHHPGLLWAHWRRGHLDDDVGRANRSQRAELWSIILAPQPADGIHLGVDNLGVVRHVGRLLDGNVDSRATELVEEGDLILLVGRMLEMRGRDTVRVSKVQVQADGSIVSEGGVLERDRIGSDAADEAAHFGRRRVDLEVIDSRRNFAGVCCRWCPVVLELHRFFIAISRAVVNHVGGAGTALDPLVWSAGALPKMRRLVHAVRDHAFFSLDQRALGMVSGSLCLLHLSLLVMLGLGHTLLGSCSSGSLS